MARAKHNRQNEEARANVPEEDRAEFIRNNPLAVDTNYREKIDRMRRIIIRQEKTIAGLKKNLKALTRGKDD